ncbi:MAG: ribosome biogenesis GTPase Der [Candidatus Gastranaerophilales bacterium]|nr:ribosome biogenesis GTPase Der [Candidatus Gastranaerophilales bacterium]
MKKKKLPTVAVIGRPNVGKSTFTNRLLGARESIVDDMPGVTRDRIYFKAEWTGRSFTLIDTGGIIPSGEGEIMVSILEQASIAMEEADAIIFITDAKSGVNPVDIDIANLLRRSEKKVFLAVNKVDAPEKTALIHEFYELGLGEPYPVSALHGSGGVGDLLDDVLKVLPECEEVEEEKVIKVAIVGKPNAGKSSLINTLLGEQRVIVSEKAGTTRDTIDSKLKINGKDYILVDTAGIRKKSRVEYGVERFAVTRAIKAVNSADVVLVVVDVAEGFSEQDKKIIALAQDSGKAVIIAMNKWDLIENKHSATINEYTNRVRKDAPYFDYIPMIFISALERQRVTKIFELVDSAYEQTSKRLPTALFNKVLLEAYALNPPLSIKGKRLKVYYATQVGIAPPHFVIFVNDYKLAKDSYTRYLDKKIREAFGFGGTPLRLFFKNRKDKGD